MMNKETDRAKIIEFLDLLGNEVYNLRKYHRPILVYKVEDGTIYYSLWEEELLDRYGLQNVDGWDYEEDTIFCPDWVIGVDSDDFFDDDDDDDDF
ncbi:MAG: hypothetical protein WC327_05415 [Candidatus Cloacimonadia bacterium]